MSVHTRAMVAAVVAAAAMVDTRAAAVAIIVVVAGLLGPAIRAPRRLPTAAELVRVLAASAVLAGAVAGAAGGAAAWALTASLVAVAALSWTLAGAPAAGRAVAASAAATAAAVVVAVVVALRARVPDDPVEVLTMLAAATLGAFAAVRWRQADGVAGDARDRLTATAAALGAVGLVVPVVSPAWRSATELGVALIAAAVVVLGATVGRSGARLVTAGARRSRPLPDPDEGSLRGLAAVVLAGPIAVLALASTRGTLPPATWAVLVPSLPAAVHLAVVARRRRRRSVAASRDALTGLPSEPVFAATLAAALRDRGDPGDGVAVAFLDLDGFKAVNDRHGHDAGDALLVEVARRLEAGVRDGDLVARRSGDEFLVLIPRVDDRERVEQVAHRLAAAVAVPVPCGDAHLAVRASIGLALWPQDAASAGELLAAADAAMYDAKAAGAHEAVRWCSAAASARSRVAGRLRRDLEVTVATGAGPRIDLEDVVDLASGAVTGHVAVPCWSHPTLGDLHPPTYLPLLVDPVVARRYDDVVLEQALATAPVELPLVVPCTAASLEDDTWPARVASRVAADGRPTSALRLAVAATVVQRGGAPLLRTANRLADLGIGLEITEVGDDRDLPLRELAALPLVGIELAAPLTVARRRSTDTAVVGALIAVAATWGLPVRAVRAAGPTSADLLAAGIATARRPSWRHPPVDEPLRTRGRDLDHVARALLEGRVELGGSVVEEVLDRVLTEVVSTPA